MSSTTTDIKGKITGNIGMIFTPEINITESTLEITDDFIKYQERDKPVYDTKTNTINWNRVQVLDYENYFEVYAVRKNTEAANNTSNECYLYNHTHSSVRKLEEDDKSIVLKTTKEKSIPFKIDDDYTVVVVQVIKEPVPMRIVYPQLELEKSRTTMIVIIVICSIVGCILVIGIICVGIKQYKARKNQQNENNNKERMTEMEKSNEKTSNSIGFQS